MFMNNLFQLAIKSHFGLWMSITELSLLSKHYFDTLKENSKFQRYVQKFLICIISHELVGDKLLLFNNLSQLQ